MPRILRIINRLNLGGPTYNVSYLSRFLAPEFETMLLSGIKQEDEESSEFIVDQMGLKPVYIHEMKREINFSSDYRAYRAIKKIIREWKPDIVHTHAAKAGTLGRLAAIRCRVPVILHTFHGHVFHSYFSPLKTRVFLEIERYLARHTTGIIAISEIQKDELCRTFKVCDPARSYVIPLGFDLTRFQENRELKRKQFREQYGLRDDDLAIGMIGRLTAIKNNAMFIRAFKMLSALTSASIKGFLIGDGEDKPMLMDLCHALGLTTSSDSAGQADIVFTSWIKEIDWAIAGLDMIAMTSLNEGTPVSLIEAQAGNRPVVTTRVGGIENVVKENQTALLSASNDVAAFAQNLAALCNNDTLRNAFSANGWNQVKDRFHYTGLVENMRLLYRRLLNEKAGS